MPFFSELAFVFLCALDNVSAKDFQGFSTAKFQCLLSKEKHHFLILPGALFSFEITYFELYTIIKYNGFTALTVSISCVML